MSEEVSIIEAIIRPNLTYYFDSETLRLEEMYGSRIHELQIRAGMTGDKMEESCLAPFLNVALTTRRFWGYNITGINYMWELYSDSDGVNMDFARAAWPSRRQSLIDKGFLRQGEHQGTQVYFLTERTIRTALGLPEVSGISTRPVG